MNIDLSNWKLQLPIDAKGNLRGKAAEVTSPASYSHPDYFHTGNGGIVLAAPVNGATTGNSDYTRSELREMNGSATAGWSVAQKGRLSATMQVDAAPSQSDGTFGKIVVGQIHGGDGQLVRLAWEDGTLFFANDKTTNGTKDLHIELLNASGQQPNVSRNETFSYVLDVSANILTVSVKADGTTYSHSSPIHRSWADNAFYFKAGAYLGVNEKSGSGVGQVSIFRLNVDHDLSNSLNSPTIIPALPLSAAPLLSDAVSVNWDKSLHQSAGTYVGGAEHSGSNQFFVTYDQDTGEVMYDGHVFTHSAVGFSDTFQNHAMLGGYGYHML